MRLAKLRQLKRIEQVLQSDRLGISGDCKEVLKGDIISVLACYFELNGEVEVKIESAKNGFRIFICAEGQAFKGFKLVSN